MIRWLALGGALLIVLSVLSLAVLGAMSGRADGPGGRLAPCGDSPNCVGSRDARPRHRVEPLPVEGSPEESFARAVEAVLALPRTRVVTAEPGYLHAECRSALFRFVDDLELELDAEAGVIHVRSASRLGYSDLGANRRRVERLRAAL